MNFKLPSGLTLDELTTLLQKEFPEYETTLKKNPLLRFEYIQVKKSAFIGVWVRIFEKKEKINLQGAVPSTFARGFLGGLLLVLFTARAQKRLVNEVATIIKDEYNVEKI